MSLLQDAINSDSGMGAGAKYLLNVVEPFFEMPLTGDTDKVRDFQLQRLLGELDALIFRLPPNPSNNQRMRFIAQQLISFAHESGVPLGSDERFLRWVQRNGTQEDIVMETVFEIDRFVDSAYTMVSGQVQELQSIRKNLLVNFNILQDLQEMMISGGPGSTEELEAFETAVDTNLNKARTILDSFDYF